MALTVITRDAAMMTFSAYVNGVLQFSVDDSGVADWTGGGVAHFFEDDAGTNFQEASGGFVDYIAIYDCALDANDVANLPIITAVPEPAALVAGGLFAIFGVARRRRSARTM